MKQTVPPGKQLVTINLDETYVGYYQGLFKGNLAVTKKSWPITQKPLSQPASRSQLRTGLTHVGLLCDVPCVQRLLPQVLIAADKVLPMGVWRTVVPQLPSWMYIIRMPSKWVTVDCLIWILNLIAWSLRAVKHLYDIVLQMDVLAQHYSIRVVNAARSHGIRLHFIPGKLTWLLQPLDTHAFALYKRYMKKIALDYKAMNPDASISVEQWLLFIRDTIQRILIDRNGANAFRQNGFGDHQASVSTFILRHLSHDVQIPVSSAQPTTDELRCIFPKGRTSIDLSQFITPPLAFPKVAPMLPPLPLPALVPPPAHMPIVKAAAPSGLIFETPFLSARAKPSAPVSLRTSPFVKWARPKIVPAPKSAPAKSSAVGSIASAVVVAIPKA